MGLRNLRQARVGGDRQQISNSSLRAGEIVPALQAPRRRPKTAPSKSATPPPTITSARIQPWALFCAVPFGLNTRQQNAWFYDGDGMKLMNDFAKKS
jgi:TRAP-type mannitol/chloroaromatic compound transport system substrate-binding protein